MPLWGTCLGSEMLAMLISGNDTILSTFSAENISLPLHFTPEAASSQLFSGMPPGVEAAFREPITVNEHELGLAPDSYAESTQLRTAVRILSHNEDRNGKAFVSSFEHKHLPVFATQFHPERPAFEWITQRYIPHSAPAILGMQFLADRFADHVRKAAVPGDALKLIYDFAPVASEASTAYYEQMYAFPLWKGEL